MRYCSPSPTSFELTCRRLAYLNASRGLSLYKPFNASSLLRNSFPQDGSCLASIHGQGNACTSHGALLASTKPMTGYALQGDEATTDGAAAVWPGELDEHLISELLSDDSLFGSLHVPATDSDDHCSGDKVPDAAAAQVTTAAERDVPQPEAVSRALCSVYSGPTIQDIEKALSSASRPCHWSHRRYSSMYL
jgi:hypothetical protein